MHVANFCTQLQVTCGHGILAEEKVWIIGHKQDAIAVFRSSGYGDAKVANFVFQPVMQVTNFCCPASDGAFVIQPVMELL
jgi:hypothetical protein